MGRDVSVARQDVIIAVDIPILVAVGGVVAGGSLLAFPSDYPAFTDSPLSRLLFVFLVLNKRLLVNFDCSALWVKKAAHVVDAMSVKQDILYSNEDQGDVPDFKDWQV